MGRNECYGKIETQSRTIKSLQVMEIIITESSMHRRNFEAQLQLTGPDITQYM